MSEQTIELDCPPGAPRPSELIGAVIEGTGLAAKEPADTFFGGLTRRVEKDSGNHEAQSRGTLSLWANPLR